ncbi:MAG: hypothetical protein DMF76_16840 [Acidobacteria bacterium]|nr:MAG: hypothetical protein DMF76_16840 [Acidobacteriota bacterium]
MGSFDFSTGEVLSHPTDLLLQDFAASNRSPDWSPDGKSLAYVVEHGPRAGEFSLAIRSLETDQVRELRPQLVVWIGFVGRRTAGPSWSRPATSKVCPVCGGSTVQPPRCQPSRLAMSSPVTWILTAGRPTRGKSITIRCGRVRAIRFSFCSNGTLRRVWSERFTKRDRGL